MAEANPMSHRIHVWYIWFAIYHQYHQYTPFMLSHQSTIRLDPSWVLNMFRRKHVWTSSLGTHPVAPRSDALPMSSLSSSSTRQGLALGTAVTGVLYLHGGFQQWGSPKMEGLLIFIQENLLKWMIWGYPYSRKPPYLWGTCPTIKFHEMHKLPSCIWMSTWVSVKIEQPKFKWLVIMFMFPITVAIHWGHASHVQTAKIIL